MPHSSQKLSSAAERPQSRAGLALEARAEQDAAELDAVASGALAAGRDVLVRPTAARRLAQTLRALALLSREATA